MSPTGHGQQIFREAVITALKGAGLLDVPCREHLGENHLWILAGHTSQLAYLECILCPARTWVGCPGRSQEPNRAWLDGVLDTPEDTPRIHAPRRRSDPPSSSHNGGRTADRRRIILPGDPR